MQQKVQSQSTLCSTDSSDVSIHHDQGDDTYELGSSALEVKTEPSASSSNLDTTSRCRQKLQRFGIPLLLGQFLAGLIGITAICSTLLVNHQVSLPLAQNLPLYFLLSVCYGLPRLVCLIRSQPKHQVWSHKVPTGLSTKCRTICTSRYTLYVVAGLIDIHANWAIVSAYAYTTATSIQLLDCITIPTVVILSYVFLNNCYSWNHYLSLVLCLIGSTGMVLTDYYMNPQNVTSNSNQTIGNGSSLVHSAQQIILGDFLVILGAIAYGFSNVLQQYLVVQYGILDFLGFMGFAAFVPMLVYSFSIEWHQISWTFFDPTSPIASKVWEILGYFAGYLVAMFLLYSTMPYVMARTSAVLVNLSLLTADVYALLMGIYLFHYEFHLAYIGCFFVILVGVGLFNIKQPQIRTDQTSCCVQWVRKCCYPSQLDKSSSD